MQIETQTSKRTTLKLLCVVCGMFGFGFALVPLYDALCDLTGLNGKTQGQYVVDEQVDEQSETEVSSRLVKMQFLASNNAGMPWVFRPVSRSLSVNPGKLNTTEFFVHNPAGRTIIAQAVPSVTPFRAAKYLHKTECFCFDQQKLVGGESMDMPLRFIIDKDLPEDIKTITLSYTLFDITEQISGELAATN